MDEFSGSGQQGRNRGLRTGFWSKRRNFFGYTCSSDPVNTCEAWWQQFSPVPLSHCLDPGACPTHGRCFDLKMFLCLDLLFCPKKLLHLINSFFFFFLLNKACSLKSPTWPYFVSLVRVRVLQQSIHMEDPCVWELGQYNRLSAALLLLTNSEHLGSIPK